MRSIDGLDDVPGFYRDFAEHEAAAESATFAQWAAGVAEDRQVLALIRELPRVKRQPNLVFAAARWHGAVTPSSYEDDGALREILLTRWPQVRETILARATQTNEVARCTALLPLLATLPGPLALIEVGASAGLCLHPDRWSYRYVGEGGEEVARVDPATGASPVVLDCTVEGPVPIPPSLPEVVHRGGVDLNPLDLSADGNAAWLETLVWPEHEDRRVRLSAAAGLVADEPVDIVRGDLLTMLDEAIVRARASTPDATLVIFHTAVVVYLDEEGRRSWQDVVTGALERERAAGRRAHWISNEGSDILPAVSATARCESTARATFCLALDGRAVGWAHGHGRHLVWC